MFLPRRLFFALAFFGLPGGAWAEPPGPLASVAWLAEHRAQVVILDVREDTDSFTLAPPTAEDRRRLAASLNLCSDAPPPPGITRSVGHIEGAVLIPAATLHAGQDAEGVTRQAPSPEDFAAQMQAAGVNATDTVVISHPGATIDHFTFAARLYWLLKLYGHDAVTILDGGITAWERAGLPLVGTAVPPTPGDFMVREVRHALLATTAEVEHAVASGGAVQLVDGRPVDQFDGRTTRSYVYSPGHIPGAVNLPVNALADISRPLHLFPEHHQRNSLVEAGLDPDQPTIVYCNSGRYVAAHWFVMSELLGNRAVKLYDGSLHAWTLGQTRPTVTGAE